MTDLAKYFIVIITIRAIIIAIVATTVIDCFIQS